MYRKNIVSGAVVLAVFVFLLLQAFQLSEQAAYWPKFVCLTGIVLSLGNILTSFMELQKERAAGKAEDDGVFPLTGKQVQNALIVLVVLAVWGFGISRVGFLVTSVLCMSVIFLIFMPDKDGKHAIRNILIAVAVGAVFYFLFRQLGVRFPKTILM